MSEYTIEKRERDGRIAVAALEYRWIATVPDGKCPAVRALRVIGRGDGHMPAEGEGKVWVAATGKEELAGDWDATLPRFHISEEAKALLLKWIDNQDSGEPPTVADFFVGKLVMALPDVRDQFAMGRGAFYAGEVLALMTASPEQVAIAADQALSQAGYYKEVQG